MQYVKLKWIIQSRNVWGYHLPNSLFTCNNSTLETMYSSLVWASFSLFFFSILQTVICFPYLGGVIELGVTELVICFVELDF